MLYSEDMLAKIAFGTLVHQVWVLRSRNDDLLDPITVKRPRRARSDSVYVSDNRAVDFDED